MMVRLTGAMLVVLRAMAAREPVRGSLVDRRGQLGKTMGALRRLGLVVGSLARGHVLTDAGEREARRPWTWLEADRAALAPQTSGVMRWLRRARAWNARRRR